jgi:adenylate cyclase
MVRSDGMDETEALRAEVERLRARAVLAERVDDALERSLRDRLPLERVVPEVLETLRSDLGAAVVEAHSLDEALRERIFAVGGDPTERSVLQAALRRDGRLEVAGQPGLVVPLDVAGELIGVLAVRFDGPPPEDAAARLTLVAERLDNHLGAVAQARRRYEVIRGLSDGLKDPVLERGLDTAIRLLQREIDFEHLLLVFRHEDALDSPALRYKVYLDGALRHESARPRDREVDALFRAEATAFLAGHDEALRRAFGIDRFREEVLISGVRSARVIGRLVVTSRHGEFHTHDRELLDRFADTLRQRIVDFNREWKRLAAIFPDAVCERLLREEGYVERYLTPREGHAAVLYGDIAGFTRLSEQVLQTPEAVGRLIDTWAAGAVDLVWESGGAFDKMVGDCVIAFWGPPFYELSPREAALAAVDMARKLRAWTRTLGDHPNLPELRGLAPPPDVAIGLHYTPLSLGLFGPDEDFTGFGSGMNNAARLQGVASGGEILVMEDLAALVGDVVSTGPLREAAVKNVAEPLRFRAVR